MGRRLVAVAVLAVLGMAPAGARAAVWNGFSVGVDVAATVPFLDWEDASGFGIGGLGYAAYTALPVVHITLRAGYIHGFQHGPRSMQHIPVLAGLKVYPIKALGLYAALEGGPVWNQRTVSSEGKGFRTQGGATGGIGFTFGPVDGRVAVFLPDVVHADEMLGLLLTVGYRW